MVVGALPLGCRAVLVRVAALHVVVQRDPVVHHAAGQALDVAFGAVVVGVEFWSGVRGQVRTDSPVLFLVAIRISIARSSLSCSDRRSNARL